jgi:hypothetical protein
LIARVACPNIGLCHQVIIIGKQLAWVFLKLFPFILQEFSTVLQNFDA